MIKRGTLLALVIFCSTAFACPICHTATGGQVRAGIFNAHFGDTVLLTLLPFPVFLGIVALIHFGPTDPRKRDSEKS